LASGPSFRALVVSLWFRLVSLAVVGLVFAETLFLGKGQIQGWLFYLTSLEVVFEVAVRLVFTALLGIGLGTVITAIIVAALTIFKNRRAEIAEWAVKVAVVIVILADSKLSLTALIKWSYQIAEHRGIFDMTLVGAFYLLFVLVLYFPKSRHGLFTSLDPFLTERFTRRALLATIGLTIGLSFVEFAVTRPAHPIRASAISEHPKSNILLITFDALAADDMSTYGYKLPTTPNIDAFARKATVFTNYYSVSTFTTPCVATMLTGMYPSQTHVYHLQARLEEPQKTLPQLAREGGYTTASFFSNPYAYYLAKSVDSKYDLFGAPVFERGGMQHLWTLTKPLHQDSGFGNRLEEYMDLASLWNNLEGRAQNSPLEFRAAETFEQGQSLISKLPDGFFLWIHVLTPHGPYLPDSMDRGRFLSADIKQIFEGRGKPDWKPIYSPNQQKKVDEWHLRYDEFILTADRAFGEFMSDFEKSSKFANTTVIVSADHGESFSGGIFEHGSAYLTRPIVHIPLMIHTAGEETSHRVSVVADQTALAPTILELGGLPRPDWMHGQSLAGWLDHQDSDIAQGLAFTQYFEKNSIFKPLHHGMVGVIDGQYQYVLELDTSRAWLRPIKEAENWNLDRTADNPTKAAELRAAIYAKFPELGRQAK
jgi:arylsulfatase A-like enzyme